MLRRVRIVYFLEDDTMSVKVLADHKRGMNEHQILRKHLVPKPQSAEMYTWRDLSPGCDINLFGRVIHIVSTDKMSGMWMARTGKAEGITFGENEEMPPELMPSLAPPRIERRKIDRTDPGRKTMLARMGVIEAEKDDVAKWLKFNGQVLSFQCVWYAATPCRRCLRCAPPDRCGSLWSGRDDPSLGHEGLRKMELKYFLEDETVSVQQVGAEKLLLKRQLLPKKFSWADQDLRPLAPSSSETIEMLTLDDIEVGGAIDVLGRPMRVYDCDPPSRALGECSNGWLRLWLFSRPTAAANSQGAARPRVRAVDRRAG